MISEETRAQSDKTLLHFCGEAKHFSLFEEICSTQCLPRENIFACLNTENSPLNQITDGPSMFKILANIGLSSKLSSLTIETKHEVFKSICKHNLQKAMELFQDSLSTKEIIEFVKVKDTNEGVNALMIAAITCSDKVLMTMITSIFLSQHCPREEKGQLLHAQDGKGRTLMSIIIGQGESLKFAKELLLKIERDFFREEDNFNSEMVPLVQYFQDNLGPSRDVAAALDDEQAYLTPTSGKIKTWILVFGQFMVPFTIYMQDIVTDGLLAGEYFKEWKKGTRLSTCQQLNQCNSSSDLSNINQLLKYPKELDPYPCFNYSIAFILMPLGCFFSEWFIHKRHALMKKVKKLFDCSFPSNNFVIYS